MQSYPHSRLQLIVIDNGSTDGSYECAQSFSGVTVLREPEPGSYAARNAGLARAQGTYVAFLDSDCVPDRRWVEEAVTIATRIRIWACWRGGITCLWRSTFGGGTL